MPLTTVKRRQTFLTCINFGSQKLEPSRTQRKQSKKGKRVQTGEKGRECSVCRDKRGRNARGPTFEREKEADAKRVPLRQLERVLFFIAFTLEVHRENAPVAGRSCE